MQPFSEAMLDSKQIMLMHDAANRAWHLDETLEAHANQQMTLIVMLQHRANFDLWHEEDKARKRGASDALITAVKHAIDEHNQERNDYVEQIDALLMREASPQNPAAPLHSETPGLIIDRLSILSLKIYHTRQETTRTSGTDAHRARNLERLEVLEQQRADLAQCLDELWGQVVQGARRFKLYRQLKMYNDPELNPELYGEAS